MENETKEKMDNKVKDISTQKNEQILPKQPLLTMPMAVIIAAFLIGGGIYLSNIQKIRFLPAVRA